MAENKKSAKKSKKVLTREKTGGIITKYKEAEHISVLTVPQSEYG